MNFDSFPFVNTVFHRRFDFLLSVRSTIRVSESPVVYNVYAYVVGRFLRLHAKLYSDEQSLLRYGTTAQRLFTTDFPQFLRGRWNAPASRGPLLSERSPIAEIRAAALLIPPT